MKVLNINTKKAQGFVDAYVLSTTYRVRDAYSTKCSSSKQNAEDAILGNMRKVDGWGYRVCSSNSFNFTCGYWVVLDGVECLIYETSTNTYVIPNDYDISKYKLELIKDAYYKAYYNV